MHGAFSPSCKQKATCSKCPKLAVAAGACCSSLNFISPARREGVKGYSWLVDVSHGYGFSKSAVLVVADFSAAIPSLPTKLLIFASSCLCGVPNWPFCLGPGASINSMAAACPNADLNTCASLGFWRRWSSSSTVRSMLWFVGSKSRRRIFKK